MASNQGAYWPGWETTRLIGRGSFGAVYEIQRKLFEDDDEAEKAALKVISIPQNDSDIEEMYSDGYDEESVTSTFHTHLKSIVAEYSLMRKMNGSSNIVNCDDVRYVQHDDGIGWDIYIKMELLTPLAKALPTAVSEEQVIRIAKDMCAALELCQKHNIIHRDIKPQNIFVSENGDYKLGDFGIAKTVEKTMGGTKTGTYKYMAPEVYSNRPYNSTADIYSTGLVLYWLLNERRMPFMPLPPEKLKAGMDEESRSRRFAGEKIPAPKNGSKELQEIVLKACAFNPEDRYQSAAELLADLNALGGVPAVVVLPVKNKMEERAIPDVGSAEEDATVGPVLGKVLINVDADKTVGPVFKPVAVDESAEGEKTVGPVFVPKDKPKQPKKKKKVWWVIAALVVTAVVLALVQCDSGPPEQLEWSEWMEDLPDYATEEFYDIEEQTLYRSRNLETTSSTTQSAMAGWELYDTVEGNGEFGEWSEWSASEVTGNENREVETQTRYHYRDKETTSSSEPTMSGWEYYDTTYTWGDYGSWSSWSTDVISSTDSRQVQTKRQYRFRSITINQQYSDWSSWGNWVDNRESTNDLKKEESRTVWGYYYYQCPNCGAHMHGYGITCPTWAGGCGKATIPNNFNKVWSTTSWSNAGLKGWHGTGKQYTYINGSLVFKWSDSNSKTQYRYATRTLVDNVSYGAWSGWSDSEVYSSSSRDVETRMVYSYRDREQIPTYHFWRWGGWSDWSAGAVSKTDNRQVETTLYYRYRDRQLETIYYFQRWGEWSDYATTPIYANDTTEVEIIKQYRFKSKDS